MDYSLRPARMEDLKTVLSWVENPESMRVWGGAALPFPGTPETIWTTIGADERSTYTLVDRAHDLVAFGQILPRDPNVHLARIIVAPHARGQGVGRVLCRELMRTAQALHHPKAFTLNVYVNNVAALALYRSLGFEALACVPGTDSLRMYAEVLHPSPRSSGARRRR